MRESPLETIYDGFSQLQKEDNLPIYFYIIKNDQR